MFRGVSLAYKCTLLFGAAIILIILGALVAPWFRMTWLIDAGQLEVSRSLARTWLALGPAVSPEDRARAGLSAAKLSAAEAQARAAKDPFLAAALDAFRADPALTDLQDARWAGTTREYLYALALRENGELSGVVLLERRSLEASRLLVLNSGYLLSTGVVVLLFATLVFFIITRRLILSPLRELTLTAERVREGNWAIRSDLRTGDEFEQLGLTLNTLLEDLRRGQDRLRAINASLDLKLHEMSEANLTLHQAAKLKGDFLANVSHELRTPLNSIIGFTELLTDIARADAQASPPESNPVVAKRLRYLDIILTAARNLLALINTLLEMAKLEAGKVDVRAERINLSDACQGLLALIAPLAAKKNIQLRLEASDDLPIIETDPRKFQQIIFNFLSNAVKFTDTVDRPRAPAVTLRAERLVASLPSLGDRVRVSVIDNGPGIPRDEQARVFEKFYQLDATHTREHTGTGLGLAICKELAAVLQGEIQLVSEVGQGSMFSLILPTHPRPSPAPDPAPEPLASPASPTSPLQTTPS